MSSKRDAHVTESAAGKYVRNAVAVYVTGGQIEGIVRCDDLTGEVTLTIAPQKQEDVGSNSGESSRNVDVAVVIGVAAVAKIT